MGREIRFHKFQGTGNDFIILDQWDIEYDLSTEEIGYLCDRRMGIGADGLMYLRKGSGVDFVMVYFNADGNESTMCGNGGRCLVAFAKQLGVIQDKATFEAIDGLHHASIKGDIVKLQMLDVDVVEKYENHVFLDTGSPHHVQFEDNIETFDIKTMGAKIRYGEPYNDAGSNVNFVKKVSHDTFDVRTYERGVEDETLSCGTGATAVALAMHATKETSDRLINLNVQGGELRVSFDVENKAYKNVWLIGPAKFVYQGII